MDDPDQRLIYIGGCQGNQQGVERLLSDIAAGRAPQDGFYTANVVVTQDMISEESISELGRFIDSLADEVEAGRVRWVTLSKMAELWGTEYGARAFRYDCGTGAPLSVTQNRQADPVTKLQFWTYQPTVFAPASAR